MVKTRKATKNRLYKNSKIYFNENSYKQSIPLDERFLYNQEEKNLLMKYMNEFRDEKDISDDLKLRPFKKGTREPILKVGKDFESSKKSLKNYNILSGKKKKTRRKKMKGGADNEEEKCSICLDELTNITNNGSVITLPCNHKHKFHRKCIREWSKISKTCPFSCPIEFEDEDIIDNDFHLLTAAQDSNIDDIKHYLSLGADINATDDDGDTLLMNASAKGDIEIVEYLIGEDVNVNVANKEKFYNGTALHFASKYGHADVVKALIDAGAQVNASTDGGYTALQLASMKGYLPVVNTLLAAGADIKTKSDFGVTALHWASYKGNVQVVNALINADANVKAQNNSGWTALMVASYYGKTDVVNTFLDAGADIKTTNNDGETALILANKNSHTDIVELLEKAIRNKEAKIIMDTDAKVPYGGKKKTRRRRKNKKTRRK